MEKKIVLASASPRRKRLLEQLGLDFKIVPSSVDEHFEEKVSPPDVVERLALRKAGDVAERCPDSLIIAADTVVVYGDDILEKPGSQRGAVEMLSMLSGEKHDVFTGVALIKSGAGGNIQKETSFSVKTEVWFGELTGDEISSYVRSGSPMDKAGGYGIQDDWGALFVERIHGDYYNVVGFPLYTFYRTLKSFAPEFLNGFNL